MLKDIKENILRMNGNMINLSKKKKKERLKLQKRNKQKPLS